MRPSRLVTLEGFVIKRKNIGEGDRVVTLFTKRFGKMRLVAKGVRKVSSRRGPHIEIFNKVTATLHSQKTLTEVTTRQTYNKIRSDLVRVGAAYYLCELVDGLLAENQPHEDVYALLDQAFLTLGTVSLKRIEVLRARFAKALLQRLGFLREGNAPSDIDSYVEKLLERRLKTLRLARELRI